MLYCICKLSELVKSLIIRNRVCPSLKSFFSSILGILTSVKDFKEVFLEVKCRSKNLIFRMLTQQFNLLCFFRV